MRHDVCVQHASPHRAIRAALFAVVCVGAAAVLHSMAKGCQPSWLEIGLGFPAVWLAAWPALGGERSGWELTTGLGAVQIGLHYLFTYVGPTPAVARTAAAPLSAASTMPAMPDMPISMPSMPGMTTTPTITHPSGLAMFAAHVVAVLVCGWWLRQGERDFFALCRVVAALAAAPLHRLTDAIAALCALTRVASDDVPRPRRALPNDGLRHRRTPLLTSVTFRGPPVLA